MFYEIYRIKEEFEEKYIFMSMDRLARRGLEFNPNVYEKRYSHFSDHANTLDDIYEELNIHHPADFRDYSLSVGDVIYTGGKYWFVDSIGFVDVTDKFEEVF